MDTASFLATLTDESLRREILLGLDEATISTLPSRVQAEARRHQRDVVRRQYNRREREDPERMIMQMMQRSYQRYSANRENDDNRRVAADVVNNSFMDIIKRREAKFIKAGDDLGKMTISQVFSDDKNLKSLVKMIIIESQRKNPIKFERLIKPYENLCKNAVIRSKLHQVLMLILNNYKSFLSSMQKQYRNKNHIHVDGIFPPIYIQAEDGESMEEIQYSKVALLIFKIFNHECSKYLPINHGLIKSFFSKEIKRQNNQVQSWFSTIEKNSFEFITDSPFLSLLKF